VQKGYKALLKEANAQIETVAPEEAADLIKERDVVVVDLREAHELEREGRIEGAEHCPRGMLEFCIDPESPYHKPYFASGKAFLFYCSSGSRSALAAKTAQDMGLPSVKHIAGGLTAWQAAKLPTVAPDKSSS
jgi:rhodanese-related sulfurtransferase